MHYNVTENVFRLRLIGCYIVHKVSPVMEFFGNVMSL